MRLFVSAAERAIAARGRFAGALSGGNTPKALYELIGKGGPWDARPWPFDWAAVQTHFGDDRGRTPEPR